MPRWTFPVTATVILIAACGGGTNGIRVRSPSPAELTPSPYTGTSDDLFVRIDESVPGFAGIYYDPYPVLCIALVDPSEADAARAEVARVFGNDTSNAEIRSAKYSFAQLKSWEMRMEFDCATRETTSWDADEFQNVVRVGVSPAGSVDAVRACGLAAGIPGDALTVVTEEPIILL
jgi:hypothetical protein